MFKAYCEEKKCGDALTARLPKLSAKKLESLQENGAETKASRRYRKRVREAQIAWKLMDRQAYGLLVRACEANATAMEVLLKKGNENLTTVELLEALEQRFTHREDVGVIQAKLAAFNSMEIGPKESVENFVNRILEASCRSL